MPKNSQKISPFRVQNQYIYYEQLAKCAKVASAVTRVWQILDQKKMRWAGFFSERSAREFSLTSWFYPIKQNFRSLQRQHKFNDDNLYIEGGVKFISLSVPQPLLSISRVQVIKRQQGMFIPRVILLGRLQYREHLRASKTQRTLKKQQNSSPASSQLLNYCQCNNLAKICLSLGSTLCFSQRLKKYWLSMLAVNVVGDQKMPPL